MLLEVIRAELKCLGILFGGKKQEKVSHIDCHREPNGQKLFTIKPEYVFDELTADEKWLVYDSLKNILQIAEENFAYTIHSIRDVAFSLSEEEIKSLPETIRDFLLEWRRD